MERLSSDNGEDRMESNVLGQSRIGKVLVTVAVVLFVVSLGWSLWLLRPSESRLVDIVSDGEVLYTIDLSVAKNQELTIFYQGSSNTVKIENGEIRVQEAQCPDKTCVKMGKLHSESLPIVCLPNRLTIRYAE